MKFFRKGFLFILMILCGAVSPASERVAYTITPLGGLSGTPFASGKSINNAGEIVGNSADRAFLWADGVMSDLGTLGGDVSTANAINDSGQVVGESRTVGGERHGFLWAGGKMIDLGVPGQTSSAHGINDQAVIVGVSSARNLRGGAVEWQNQALHFLGDLGPSGSGSTAMAINDKGMTAGVSSGFIPNQGGVVRAVIWKDGTVEDIGTLGGLHSTALDLNNRGQVVGWAETTNGTVAAFVWHDGSMADLGALPGRAATKSSGSQALAINQQNQIVGSSMNANNESRAVIWENGGIWDLNDLIPSDSGIVLTRATAINDKGQIVVEQEIRPNGPTKTYLLTPRQH